MGIIENLVGYVLTKCPSMAEKELFMSEVELACESYYPNELQSFVEEVEEYDETPTTKIFLKAVKSYLRSVIEEFTGED
jgi:hypothetical protein